MAMKVERCDLDVWFSAEDFCRIALGAYYKAVADAKQEVKEEVPGWLRDAAREGDLNPPPYFDAEAFAGRVMDFVAVRLCALAAERSREVGLAIESGGCVFSASSSGLIGAALVDVD